MIKHIDTKEKNHVYFRISFDPEVFCIYDIILIGGRETVSFSIRGSDYARMNQLSYEHLTKKG